MASNVLFVEDNSTNNIKKKIDVILTILKNNRDLVSKIMEWLGCEPSEVPEELLDESNESVCNFKLGCMAIQDCLELDRSLTCEILLRMLSEINREDLEEEDEEKDDSQQEKGKGIDEMIYNDKKIKELVNELVKKQDAKNKAEMEQEYEREEDEMDNEETNNEELSNVYEEDEEDGEDEEDEEDEEDVEYEEYDDDEEVEKEDLETEKVKNEEANNEDEEDEDEEDEDEEDELENELLHI